MKIGIVTYVKCDNYGAELQAFALQWKLNTLGYDAEVINLEKRDIDMKRNPDVIKGAILQRIRKEGAIKAFVSVLRKVFEVRKRIVAEKKYASQIKNKHRLFEDFFETKVKHSLKYYSLEEISSTKELPYDVYIAGSDQIWNYIHTDRLDVYFLMFVNKFKAKKISYAASVSVYDIPEKWRGIYKKYFENIDVLSVRELHGADLVKKYSSKTAEVVLDPTFLLNREDWLREVAVTPETDDDYLLVYTLSGSLHIRQMALEIAKKKNLKVYNIKSNYVPEPDDGVKHFYEIGPAEWVGLWSRAKFVVTDSFHGTAFSINFNVPFITLVNPNSMMNSRVLSILKITGLENRIVYDTKEDCGKTHNLEVDFGPVNEIVGEWKTKSLLFLQKALEG